MSTTAAFFFFFFFLSRLSSPRSPSPLTEQQLNLKRASHSLQIVCTSHQCEERQEYVTEHEHRILRLSGKVKYPPCKSESLSATAASPSSSCDIYRVSTGIICI